MHEDELPVRERNERVVRRTDPNHHAVTLVCECGHPLCDDAMVVTPAEYEVGRARGGRLVSPQHEHVAEGHVLGRNERFLVVVDD